MDRQGRQLRIHIPNTIHHVMIRGNNRQRIFFNDNDFDYFLNSLQAASEKFDHKIILYCLMNNHVHLLIHILNSSLSLVMQKINYRYARWFNYKRDRIGHVFQGRYRSLEVGTDEYFINLCRYIHLNPVAANIVINPDEYPWSSHHHYIKNNYPDWMDHKIMISAIEKKANLNYRDFMLQPVNRNLWQPALYISDTGKIIHNDVMLHELQKKTHVADNIMRKFLPENQVLDIICDKLNISKTQLFGSSKNHRASKQRILLAYYLIQYANKNMAGVAKFFQKTQGTLSRQLQQFSEEPEKYFTADLLDDIKKILNQQITKQW